MVASARDVGQRKELQKIGHLRTLLITGVSYLKQFVCEVMCIAYAISNFIQTIVWDKNCEQVDQDVIR